MKIVTIKMLWLLHWRTKFHIDISSRLWVIGVSNVENQTHTHTRTHTHKSGCQLKITFLDVLGYSAYSDTKKKKWKKKFHENIACSVRKRNWNDCIIFYYKKKSWNKLPKRARTWDYILNLEAPLKVVLALKTYNPCRFCQSNGSGRWSGQC